ncbi:hypothetical protein OF83DRAFT_673501 [Amylostereum chailletii]|nr:hypothetical protein OF83DRAFT_673501 [Amylostereum chailletii]
MTPFTCSTIVQRASHLRVCNISFNIFSSPPTSKSSGSQQQNLLTDARYAYPKNTPLSPDPRVAVFALTLISYPIFPISSSCTSPTPHPPHRLDSPTHSPSTRFFALFIPLYLPVTHMHIPLGFGRSLTSLTHPPPSHPFQSIFPSTFPSPLINTSFFSILSRSRTSRIMIHHRPHPTPRPSSLSYYIYHTASLYTDPRGPIACFLLLVVYPLLSVICTLTFTPHSPYARSLPHSYLLTSIASSIHPLPRPHLTVVLLDLFVCVCVLISRVRFEPVYLYVADPGPQCHDVDLNRWSPVGRAWRSGFPLSNCCQRSTATRRTSYKSRRICSEVFSSAVYVRPSA